jgi:hemerythrin superfamily protein
MAEQIDQIDVVDLIMQDHRELEKMFDELSNHPEKRLALVPVMTNLLFAHSRAEESQVYPAAREAGGTEDVEHSQKEHLAADQLAEKLGETDHESPEFDEVLKELVHAVKHHLEEEEETVLPHMRERMDEGRLDELAQKFLDVRAENLGDQPGDMTKGDLEQQAENIGMPVGDADKETLKEKLEDEAEL